MVRRSSCCANHVVPAYPETRKNQEREFFTLQTSLSLKIIHQVRDGEPGKSHAVAVSQSDSGEAATANSMSEVVESGQTLDLFLLDSSSTSGSDVLQTEKPSRKRDVSTALCLYDETWAPSQKRNKNTEVKPNSTPRKAEREGRRIKLGRSLQERTEVGDGKNETGVSTQFELCRDPWRIKKNLTPSDLGNQCRLLISSVMIQKHVIPFLSHQRIQDIEGDNGLIVEVWDHDTKTIHKLVLRKWKATRSYVFISRWKMNFVARRGLKVGDTIGLFWDANGEKFHFSVLERASMT